MLFICCCCCCWIFSYFVYSPDPTLLLLDLLYRHTETVKMRSRVREIFVQQQYAIPCYIHVYLLAVFSLFHIDSHRAYIFLFGSVTLFFGFPIFFFLSSSSLRKRIALAICTGRDSVWRICLQHVILSFLLSACVHVFIYFIPFILVQSHCLPAPLSVLCLPFRNTIFNMNPIENRAQYMQCTEGVSFSFFFFSFFFISSSNVSKTLVLECVNLFRAQCYLCVCVTLFFFLLLIYLAPLLRRARIPYVCIWKFHRDFSFANRNQVNATVNITCLRELSLEINAWIL